MPCDQLAAAASAPCVPLPHASSPVLLALLSPHLFSSPSHAVSVLEVIARAYLASSLAILLRALRRKPRHKPLLHDAWGEQPADSGTLRRYELIVAAELAAELLLLLFLLLPVQHDGAFGAFAFAAHGIVDNIPWTVGMHAPAAASAGCVARALVLPLLVALCRLLLVALPGQRPVAQYFFAFAPTENACWFAFASSACYGLLLLSACLPPLSVGSLSLGPLVRRQCRGWLGFLALTYFLASFGFVLFFLSDRFPPEAAYAIGFVGLFTYAIGFAPCLYRIFTQEHPSPPPSYPPPRLPPERDYWLAYDAQRHAESLLETQRCDRGAASKGAHSLLTLRSLFKRARRGAEAEGTAPSLRGPPGAIGADSDSRAAMSAVLANVKLIDVSELTLHELVGSGGFAEVFRATWKNGAERRQVAVKQLRVLPKESQMLQSFCKEVGLMQRLDHPNVLGLLGMCIARSGTLAMVTDFLPLGSVFALLQARKPPVPPPWRLALRFLADTARGMEYLHRCEPAIIHRDLKSQNLLVASDHSVKVADFGLSRECMQPGAMTRVGSVQWAAPEVLLGETYSHKCDVWSFGVVCWELLTARVPFEKMAQHVVATRVAMEGMRLPVPSRAPPMLLRLIARCWADAADQRPEFRQIVGEIDEMLGALVAATPHPSKEQLPPSLPAVGDGGVHAAARVQPVLHEATPQQADASCHETASDTVRSGMTAVASSSRMK
ncbi:hypothetical protein AB1Y20_015876 [Prymnesium parvum]|uniref:Protein kinase domain-containing protein n=1 Tax=Prymnesium parvum TaxID=97485 RepID=A0AB34K1G1_PRYPA